MISRNKDPEASLSSLQLPDPGPAVIGRGINLRALDEKERARLEQLVEHYNRDGVGHRPAEMESESLYLDLMKRVLTRTLFDYEYVPLTPKGRARRAALATARQLAPGVDFVRRRPVSAKNVF